MVILWSKYYCYTVLDCFCWYNKMSKTGWLINNRNVFLMVLDSKQSQIKVFTIVTCSEEQQYHRLSEERSFYFINESVSLGWMDLRTKRATSLSSIRFCKITSPLYENSILMTNHISKGWLLNTITFLLSFDILICGWHIQTIALPFTVDEIRSFQR